MAKGKSNKRRRIMWMMIMNEMTKQRRQRRFYVRSVNLKRKSEGEFAMLIKKLRRPKCADDHLRYFRMTPARFDDLLSRISTRITHPPNHRMAITPTERLAVTVRFLAGGGTFSYLAYNFRISVPALCGIIRETTEAIWEELKVEFMQPPTRQRWEEISKEFWRKWNFPMCLGSIDGKHVSIKCPPHSGSMFYNYKNFFSIILLAVVDADYKFIFIDVGGYGREGDAGLFHCTPFGQRLERACETYDEGGLDIPSDNFIPGTAMRIPHVFLGDDAFPLKHHLMKPFRRHTASGSEAAFNYRLSRARRVVENAFGVLITRWRVLDGRLNVDVKLAEQVVKACCVLHNYLKSTDALDHTEPSYLPESYVDYESDNGNVVPGQWRDTIDHQYAISPYEIEDDVHRGQHRVREKLKIYFTSEEGKLPWQDALVREGFY